MPVKRRNIKEEVRDTYLFENYTHYTFANKVIGIVPVNSELVSVKESHGVAGTDAGAVTLAVERLRHTETSGTGNTVVSAINLKGTANTVQTATPNDASTVKFFEAGDRVSLILTGTSTGLAYVNTVVTFRPMDENVYNVTSASVSPSISSSVSSSTSISSSVSSSVSSSDSISSSASSSISSSASIS